MEKLDFSARKIKPKNITKDQYTASLIYDHFYGNLKFGHLISIVKRIGNKAAFEILSEVKQANCNNPKALFLWKCGQEQTIWKTQ